MGKSRCCPRATQDVSPSLVPNFFSFFRLLLSDSLRSPFCPPCTSYPISRPSYVRIPPPHCIIHVRPPLPASGVLYHRRALCSLARSVESGGGEKNLQCMLRHGDIFVTSKFILCSRSSSLYTNALKGLVRQASRFCGRIHREGESFPPLPCVGDLVVCGLRRVWMMDAVHHTYLLIYTYASQVRVGQILPSSWDEGGIGEGERREMDINFCSLPFSHLRPKPSLTTFDTWPSQQPWTLGPPARKQKATVEG